MLPNGATSVAFAAGRTRNNKTTVIPGSTIVIPREARPFDWLILASTVTPILADVALAIATIDALTSRN